VPTYGGLKKSTTGVVRENPVTSFNLILPTNGAWGLNFASTTEANGNPALSFIDGLFFAEASTHEPGTIALMLTGLVGIAGVAKRKFRR
jgi:hypothetical protein